MVVDECHRAVGKNDAVAAIGKLRQDQCKFRVIGLSATPGSKREAVQVLHSCWKRAVVTVPMCLQELSAGRFLALQRQTSQVIWQTKLQPDGR